MSIREIKVDYQENCIFPNAIKNEVILYSLSKKNCKKNNINNSNYLNKNSDSIIKELYMLRVFLDNNKISFQGKLKT